MTKQVLYRGIVAALMMAGTVSAQLTDDASNYGAPNPDWVDGSNQGAGFGPWTLAVLDGGVGGHFLGTSAEDGGERTNTIDTAGQAFGMWNESNTTVAVRGFDTGVWGDGSVLTFDYSFRFDGGNKGITLHDSATNEFFFFNIASGGYSWTGGGTAPPTDWVGQREFGEVLTVTVTQNGPDLDVTITGLHASSPSATETISGQTLSFFRFYSVVNEGGNGNNIYFNNFSVTEGTQPALAFIAGNNSPDALGDVTLTLERAPGEGVTDEIVLSSSNTNAVTVPDTVDFLLAENTVNFDATVVSLTEGSATIIASNVASGAWAQFVITPVVPSLFIGGPFELFATGAQNYTLDRVGAVGDDIVFSSSDETVLTVPASQSFDVGENQLVFNVNILDFGVATIFASNLASGAVADYNVTILEPSLTLSGPSSARIGAVRTYTLTRVGPIADLVNLDSSNPGAMTVPATVEFVEGNTVTFQGTAVAVGITTLTATNADAASNPLVVTVTALPVGTYDEGSLYNGSWNDSDNQGVGFGPWVFNHNTDPEGDPPFFAGVFIGNPATAGISGMDTESFGFFANPPGSAANAEVSRTLTDAMVVGDTFVFQLGLNFDSNNEGSNRGFNLLAGATQLLNINMGNSQIITINDTPMFSEYGSQAMTISIEYVADGSLRVTATGRDGVETYDQTLAVAAGAPDTFSFYFNATDGGTDERQMYVNNLQVIDGGGEPEGPTIEDFVLAAGVASVSIPVGEIGTLYTLEYTTDLTADPVIWTFVDQSEGNGVDPINLSDTVLDDSNRVYRLVTSPSPL